VALGGIFVLAILLRLWGLGQESYWYDEIHSITTATLPSLSEAFVKLSQDVHPPLYFILLRYWIALAGDSEIATRLFSALASSLTIFALYAWGRWINLPKRACLLGALFLAWNPHTIWYGQQVRMYSLEILLGTTHFALTAYIFHPSNQTLTLTKHVGPGAVLGAWYLSGMLLIWLHFFGLFYIAADLVWGCCLARRAARSHPARPLKPQRPWLHGPRVLLLLALMQWSIPIHSFYRQLARQWSTGHGFSWVQSHYTLSWKSPYEILANLLAGHRFLVDPRFLRPVCVLVLVLLIFLPLRGVWSRWRARSIPLPQLHRAIPVLTALTLLALPCLVSLWKPIILGGYRYLIIAIPSLCLAAGLGLHIALRQQRLVRYSLVAATTVVFFYQGAIFSRYPLEREPPMWREALESIASEISPEDVIVPIPAYERPVIDFYTKKQYRSAYLEDVFTLTPPPRRVWFLTTRPPYTQQERLLAATGMHYTEVLHEKNAYFDPLVRITRFDLHTQKTEKPQPSRGASIHCSFIDAVSSAIESFPMATVQQATDTLRIETEPGQGVRIFFPAIQTADLSSLRASYTLDATGEVQLSILGFNATGTDWHTMDGQHAYTTLHGGMLSSNPRQQIDCVYHAPGGWLIPALQFVNTSPARASIQIHTLHVQPAQEIDPAKLAREPLRLYPDPSFAIAKTIHTRPITIDAVGLVEQPMNRLETAHYNNGGKTRGLIRACIADAGPSATGLGSLAMRAADDTDSGLANLYMPAKFEPGHLLTQVSLRRLFGENGTMTLALVSEDGAFHTGLVLDTRQIPLDRWHVAQIRSSVPLPASGWVAVQLAKGDAVMCIDNYFVRTGLD
jgi:uncharacterized membrane protein